MDATHGIDGPIGVTVGVPSLRFEELYHAQVSTTLAVVLALRGPGADAEDVVQEAFARVLSRWDEVRAMARPDLWVQRVALNLATSRLRRRSAEARALVRLASRQEVATAAFGTEESFWGAVRRLPPKQARVVALRYAGDLAIADIAVPYDEATGMSDVMVHRRPTDVPQLGGGEVPDDRWVWAALLLTGPVDRLVVCDVDGTCGAGPIVATAVLQPPEDVVPPTIFVALARTVDDGRIDLLFASDGILMPEIRAWHPFHLVEFPE